MFLLAGLFGLLAAGAAAIVSFDAGPDVEDDTDSIAEPEQDTAPHDGAQGPMDFLEALRSGSANSTGDTTEPTDIIEEDQIISGSDLAEEILGGAGDDQINGYENHDTISGGDGDDHLYGGGGDDLLFGQAGDDLLHGEDGLDSLNGGDGDDSLFGHMQDDTLLGEAGDDSLTGGAGDDSLSGGDGDDALHGGDGDDLLEAGDGGDTLFGGDGNDLILGAGDAAGSGPDFLNGGDDDDTIYAGQGDWVTGGSGNDLVVMDDWAAGGGDITITDFDLAEDSLVLLYEDSGGNDPEVEVRPGSGSMATTEIIVDGQLVATIQGSTGLSVADIALVPQDSPEARGLLQL